MEQQTESTKIKTTHEESTFFNYPDLESKKSKSITFNLITFQSKWRFRLWIHGIS